MLGLKLGEDKILYSDGNPINLKLKKIGQNVLIICGLGGQKTNQTPKSNGHSFDQSENQGKSVISQ